MEQYSRTRFLLGQHGMDKLKAAKVAVFGLGGVGSYVVEALARSGIGALELIDHDCISLTNLNRQLFATHDTIGKSKAQAAKERVLSIDPSICVATITGLFIFLHSRMIQRDIAGTSWNGTSTAKSPRAIIIPSAAAAISHILSTAFGRSIFAIIFIGCEVRWVIKSRTSAMSSGR